MKQFAHTKSIVAVTSVVALVAISSSVWAASPGGADAPPVAPQPVTLGSMTWSFYEDVQKTYPTEAAQVADAMKQAINNYNTLAAYSGNVPVTYVTWGGVTAQASYQGSIQFGYMRSGRTAQHELSHFIGMQPWVNGGKANWGSYCNGGWSGPIGLARMNSFKPGEGIGCSGDVGHFWDYGLNQDAEYNWLSKGRNVAMVGALRADVGLSDGSTLPEKAYRLVSRSTGTSVADRATVESGETIDAASTQSTQQIWLMTLNGGYMRLKNQASQRVLDGGGTAPVLVSTPASATASAWEMIPTSDGHFMLRNQQSNKCLQSAGSGAPLQLADCDTSWSPAASFEFTLASAPPVGTGAGYALPLPADAVDCAGENQACQMPDSRSYIVFYGANGTYAVRKGVTGSIACGNATFGDAVYGVAKRCYRSAATQVATSCATEGQTCKLPDTSRYTAYYGAGGSYAARAGVTGSFACGNSTFGDPAPGRQKHCFWLAESAQSLPPANAAPTVSLTVPTNNATFTQGALISFAASAGDVDGNVAKVDLYDNGNLIGTSTVSPYRWTWGSATVGKHVFTAKATDNQGATTTSTGVNVTVNAPSATPPSGAIKCANQGGTCALPAGKTATVWFGAASSYKVRTGLSGNVACNATTFGGDPIWYRTKACYQVSN
jgi:Bacterial Ig domain/Ricin-type beta-trefoil lectin domain-like